MQILYDGIIYSSQKVGGINRYFDNIISRLPIDFCPILTTVRPSNEPHPYHPNLKLFSYRRFRPKRVSLWLASHYFQVIETLNKYQIFHPTNYSLITRRKFQTKRSPIVLTVYDMIHEIYADLIDQNGEAAEIKRRAILAADIILCISENTKRDLLERYSLPEERVWVTYLATDFNPNFGYGNEYIPPEPFFLYVGRRHTYKNFNSLLTAFSKIISKVPDIRLCVVGSQFNSSEQTIIAQMNINKQIQHFDYITDSHLAKLYRNCIAFVYPSLYEGFGIPLLEAMICQAPVIASNTSSIPEVVGDAGLLFDPSSISDLADRLIFLLENTAERERLMAKGLEQTQKFSWDKTVTKTVEAYRYIIS